MAQRVSFARGTVDSLEEPKVTLAERCRDVNTQLPEEIQMFTSMVDNFQTVVLDFQEVTFVKVTDLGSRLSSLEEKLKDSEELETITDSLKGDVHKVHIDVNRAHEGT